MIKRFAGQALLVAGCLISSAYAADDAASASATAPDTAGTVAINPDHPTTYTVQPGDTLWGISEKFLVNPWQWPEVWHINEQVSNPHLIYPGQTLRLVWKDGKPSLVVDQIAGQTASSANGGAVVEVMADGKTLKLRPRIREQAFETAIPTIPLETIKSFLNDSRVVTLDQLNKAPYLLAGEDKRVLMGRGDTVYAREQGGNWDPTYPDYNVYRPGAPYLDPETNELLGYEAIKIGAVHVTAIDKDVATVMVLASREDMRIKDKLLLDDQRRVQSSFMPRPPPAGLTGRVVAVMGSIGSGARGDVVVINKGEKDQVGPGHVFAVHQKGDTVRDATRGDVVELPDVKAGLVIVFRSFERVSYALITRTSRPVTRNDMLVAPAVFQ